MIILLSLLVALVGLLLYVMSGNPKLNELGRILFFCGMLAFLLQTPGAHFGVLTR